VSDVKHTPGPWEASIGCGSGDHWYVFRKTAEIDGARFCRVDATNRNEEARATAKANSLLIAAAPELLAALIQLRQAALDFRGDLVINESVSSETFAKMFAADDAAQAAIEKATPSP
jgi:hypothetical protein